MDPFVSHTGTAAPLRMSHVDTDQIIPARFCVGVSRSGYGDALFRDKRADDPRFVLNRPQHRDATVLIAGENFGCGSSREMAVWALQNHGFRAVVAPSFGDIFRGNSFKNGLLTVVLPVPQVDALINLTERHPATPVTVDLTAGQIVAGGLEAGFTIDPQVRHRLLHGLDDITMTLQHAVDIEAYEARRRSSLPTTGRVAGAVR